MAKSLKKEKHRCTKDTVEWEEEYGETNDGCIFWYGECSCGKRVYEMYIQDDSLFDAETNEEL